MLKGIHTHKEKTVSWTRTQVSWWVPIAVITHTRNKGKLGRKGLMTCSHLIPSQKEVRTGTQTRQETGGRN